jgi:hypothetical protein
VDVAVGAGVEVAVGVAVGVDATVAVVAAETVELTPHAISATTRAPSAATVLSREKKCVSRLLAPFKI